MKNWWYHHDNTKYIFSILFTDMEMLSFWWYCSFWGTGWQRNCHFDNFNAASEKHFMTSVRAISLALVQLLQLLWNHPQGYGSIVPWWHQMETFSMSLALCVGNSPVTDEFPSQRPVMRSFDVFFDLRLNTRLSKQSWGWWFERPACSLWHHCNAQISKNC